MVVVWLASREATESFYFESLFRDAPMNIFAFLLREVHRQKSGVSIDIFLMSID